MWTLDLAREQRADRGVLGEAARASEVGGFGAIGLYLEHRFAYEGVEWAAGPGCLDRDDVAWLRQEHAGLEVVPFLNVLSHVEGFLYCEEGQPLAEEPVAGMQGNMWHPGFQALAGRIVESALEAFDSEVVHLGGDEAWQLGRHPDSQARAVGRPDPAGWLYAQHFGPLCESLLARGRRPAIWADMVLAHPGAAGALPKETLLFDWQYDGGCAESLAALRALGFEVVACPTLHTYDAAWLHLPESEANVRQVAADARDGGASGVCLTTWECALFGCYPGLFPAVAWAGAAIEDPEGAPPLAGAYGNGRRWAEAMGVALNQAGPPFAFDGHRHRLKCRLLLYGNPFLAWRHHRAELVGEAGTRALEACREAGQAATEPWQHDVADFVRLAVEFVCYAEAAKQEYAAGKAEACVAALAPARQTLEQLERIARRNHALRGGSLADIERCRRARDYVGTVMARVRMYGDRQLGYRPAFEVLVHDRFMPHDQGCWWLVNRWGWD